MKDIDKELDKVFAYMVLEMSKTDDDQFAQLVVFERIIKEMKQKIKQLITQARIDEASLILTYFDDLVDDEQAIYVQDWIKDRLKELKENK